MTPILRRERPPSHLSNALGQIANEVERPTPEPTLDDRARWAKRIRSLASDVDPSESPYDGDDILRE